MACPQVALELLAALARQPAAAAHLLHLGADRALIQLADEQPVCAHPATALLGELLCMASEAGGGQLWAGERTPEPHAQLGSVAASCSSPAPLPWPEGAHLALQPAAATHAAALPAPPPTADDLLSGYGRRVHLPALSEDDSQQLFEVALQLQPEEAGDEAVLLAALAMLQHGVLADMPAPAVAGEPAILQALLRLLDGSRSHPQAAAAAVEVLQSLAGQLESAEEAGEDAHGLALAPLAYDSLLRCAALLTDPALQHAALAAGHALLPLLSGTDAPATTRSAGCGAVMEPLLAALTESLRLCLVRGALLQWVAARPLWGSTC